MNILVTAALGAAAVAVIATSPQRRTRRELRRRASRVLEETAALRGALTRDIQQLLRLEEAEIKM